MIEKVFLPKLGQTVEKAILEKWHKKEGDKVAKGDVLCEITTDKATFEVESFQQGTVLKIIASPGEELPVNAIIAILGDPGEAIPAAVLAEAAAPPPPESGAAAEAPAPVAAPIAKPAEAEKPFIVVPAQTMAVAAAAPAATVETAAPAGKVFASPRARKLAASEHVPLVVLRGSGPEGRIVEADVVAYVAKLNAADVTPLARKIACERQVDVLALAVGGKKVTKEDVLAAKPVAAPAARRPTVLKAGRVKLTPMRRIIAERMCQSKREIPCYYVHMDADMTDLMEARKRNNSKGGVRFSVDDYILIACGRALAEFPDCNTKWDGDGIIYRGEANVGFAVALEQGLIVPVVKNIERKNLAQVAVETKQLVEKARNKKLLPSEYEGGCMTISNLGMFGVKHFIAIVNPGESCILGLGAIEERVVVRQGGIHIRRMMTLTMALDHRLIDGAPGAKFTERIRDLLENPAELEK
jgi:pyruvate dehydrogenase E2 component (dihydrolipoamide acetyltransferase)